MSLVHARGLVKRYGGTHALDGLDFTVERGRIVGLIGPNGSGKTTALKSVMGLCRLAAGELRAFELEPFTQRKTLMQRTAYIADVGILPRWMKISDLLQFVADTQPHFDLASAQRMLDATSILPKRKVRTLSKGMTVQLHLALVLASNAELLVLDEPTLGLDILYRQQFYDSLVTDYFDAQRSILLTTHEVREVEHLLTDVVFIHHGRAVLSASMESLPERFTKVLASPESVTALRAAGPVSERPSLQGNEFIFDGVPQAQLAALGKLSTPNLAELFVALIQEGSGR